MVRDRRRSRRRRAARLDSVQLVALVVGAVLVAVLVVGTIEAVGPASATYDRTLARGFAAMATPIARRSNATGAAVLSTLAATRSLPRPTLFSDLDALAGAAASESQEMAGAGSPPVTGGASDECVRALAARSGATASLRDGIEQVLGGPTGTAATAGDQPSALRLLVSAGAQMADSDDAWASCRAALARRSRAAVVPRSRWLVDPAAFDLAGLTAFVNTVVGLPALVPAPRLAIIAFDSVPAAVVSGPGPGTVPTTSSLALDVVVSNLGNVDEAGVRVSAVATPLATPATGAAAGPVATVDVASGATAAVSLPPVAVQPGGTYVVTVTAADASDGARASASFSVAVALPPPTTTTTTTTTTVPASTTTTAGPGRTTTTTVRHALAHRNGRGGTAAPSAP